MFVQARATAHKDGRSHTLPHTEVARRADRNYFGFCFWPVSMIWLVLLLLCAFSTMTLWLTGVSDVLMKEVVGVVTDWVPKDWGKYLF